MTYWPKPSKFPNTPIPTPSGKSAPGWGSPIVEFVGRYIDSTPVRGDFQAQLRTLRARTMQLSVEHDMLVMALGNMLVKYRWSTFARRIRGGEPLRAVTAGNRGAEPEMYLQPDWQFYAEHDWAQFGLDRTDGQDRLNGFDVSANGDVLVANGQYGWGILDGATGQTRSRMSPEPDFTPYRILEPSRTRRLVLVGHEIGAVTRCYDCSAPSLPRRVLDLPSALGGMYGRVKMSNGEFATINEKGELVMFESTGTGFRVIFTYRPQSNLTLNSIATSGDLIYAIMTGSGRTVLMKIDSASTFGQIEIPIRYVNSPAIRCGDGLLAIFGQEFNGSNLRLFRMDTFAEVPIAGNYFQTFYSKAYSAPGAAVPVGIDPSGLGDVLIHDGVGVIAAGGLGDVYGIRVGDGSVAQLPPQTMPAPVQLPPVLVPPQTPATPKPPLVPPVAPPSGGPPLLRAVASKTTVMVGEKIVFSVGGISPMNSGCRWLFDDGEAIGGSSTVTHAYAKAGVFDALCLVGGIPTTAVRIVVSGSAVVASTTTTDPTGKTRAVR